MPVSILAWFDRDKRRKEPTASSGCELHVSSLHAIELLSLFAFGTFLNHAIAVCELATQDVAEDLGIAMRMRRETTSGGDPVFVQNTETAEVLETLVKVAGETERVEGVQPAVIGMSAIGGTAKDNLGVRKRLRHRGFWRVGDQDLIVDRIQ